MADEIHAPLVLGDRPFTPYLTVDPAAVAVHSGSKAFNLAGLKAALAVAGPDAAAELARVPDEVSVGAGLLGVLAGEAAYRDGDEWLEPAAGRAAGQPGAARFAAGPSGSPRSGGPARTRRSWPGSTCASSTWGRTRPPTVLDRARVALDAGTRLRTGGEGFARLNLATGPTLLAEAVTRLARLVSAAPR